MEGFDGVLVGVFNLLSGTALLVWWRCGRLGDGCYYNKAVLGGKVWLSIFVI